MSDSPGWWSKVKTPLFTILAFIFGIVATLLFQNIISGEELTFSTTGLISFVFGVALSSASIVLAIAAIVLGKSSEQAIMERSDESIRLQNEVFAKTSEALSKIQSSTGTTEKRIEDLIAGRTGKISNRIYEDLFESNDAKRKSKGEIEEEIEKSIVNSVSDNGDRFLIKEEQEDNIEREKIKQEYEVFKSSVLLNIARNDNFKAEKIGDGSFHGEKDRLVDGVFKMNGKRLAVCAFSTKEAVEYRFQKGFGEFLGKITDEISDEYFNYVVLAFDAEIEDGTAFDKELKKSKESNPDDVIDRLLIDVDGPDGISDRIYSRVSEDDKST